MKKFGKFLQKAKGVLGDKGMDIGQLALSAASGDFKGVVFLVVLFQILKLEIIQ